MPGVTWSSSSLALVSLLLLAAACSAAAPPSDRAVPGAADASTTAAPAQPIAGACESGRGIALVFEPSLESDIDALKATVAAIQGAQLVMAKGQVVVTLSGRDERAFSSAKHSILEHTGRLGLMFAIEDTASIDASCTVRLDHQEAPTQPSEMAR